VEQDPWEIMSVVLKCIERVAQDLNKLEIQISDIVSVGITNQRETTIVWDKTTGQPLHNAIGLLLLTIRRFCISLFLFIISYCFFLSLAGYANCINRGKSPR